MDDFREKVLERIKDDACGMGRLCYDSGYCVCVRTADAVIRLCFEEAAKVADAEAVRLKDEWHADYAHGALLSATAIRDRIATPVPASK